MHPADTPSHINEEEVFQHAAALVPAERPAYLSAACAGDLAIRARIERLLLLHEDREFMGTPAERTVSIESELQRLKPEEAGERIENYKLLERLGEGGFGVVWVAEQEKPMRRRVALKIIKLGMDTREVIARFEQERQALAMMDHPNIAKVLDAGATPFGRPFFVLELVRGVKITEYCDQANLPTKERLQLFIAVCHAVQHAHQKGIIHRDLKPSNILVTLHDGVPVPKVIDFGVAKATQQQRLTDLTVYTQFEQMIGTPLYMSPEQAEMSGLDIDTRSDIYSLGVLLYELLVGRTPFDPQELMKAGLDEMRRVIREQEPPKPSTFLSTMALEVRTTSARRRQTDGAKWIGQIRGDLDWIVMKALEKDRTRRYETANGLAKDIERHLLSEPVQARPPTQFYRFRRFAKRNEIAFAAGTAVLAALIMGLGISTWMFFKERHARERAVSAEQEQVRLRQSAVAAEKAQSEERIKAETEASKSRQVAQFLTDMLAGVGPSVALGRDTKMLREILDKTAERLGKDLKDQPAVESDLRSIIGQVYGQLGEYEKAAAMHREALAMQKAALGNEHPDVAESLDALAIVLQHQGKLPEAEMMHREALTMRRKLLGNHDPAVAKSLNNLASALSAQGKLAEAETIYHEALAIDRKALGNENPEVASFLSNLAVVLERQAKLAEAETMHREALAMQKKLLGDEHPDVANSLNSLAVVLERQGKLAEAETVQREALAMQRKLLGNEHSDIAISVNNLALVLERQGKLVEAETMEREALSMQRKLLGDDHPDIAVSLNNLALILEDQEKLAEAETKHLEAQSMWRKLVGDEHPNIATSLGNLARVLEKQHRLAEAENVGREALAMNRKLLGDEHPSVADSFISLASVLENENKLAEAEILRRDGLAIRRKLLGEHPRVAAELNSLASLLEKENKLAGAETIHREALAMRRQLLASEHSDVAASVVKLASVLGRQGKQDEAKELLRGEIVAFRKSTITNPAAFDRLLQEFADTLYREDDYADAEPLYRELIESRRARLGAENATVLTATASLARLLADWAWTERGSKSEIRNHSRAKRDSGPEGARGSAAAESKSEIVRRAQEAERLLRDYLTIRLRGSKPTHWRTGETRSRLGGAVLAVAVTEPALTNEGRLAKFVEAESLLLEGNEALEQGEKVDRKYQRDSLVRLGRLYEAWGKREKAAVWQQKLADFDKTEAKTNAEEKPGSPEP